MTPTAAQRGGPLPGPRAALLSRAVGHPLTWLALVAIVAAFPVVRSLRADLPPPLPVLGQVPEFKLTNQDGRPFGSADLAGKVWVATFLFTRCPTVCPTLAGHAFDLQHDSRGLGDAWRLVTFTVDPVHDTPEVLREYARRNRASTRTWVFLTGPLDEVLAAVTQGLKVAMVPLAEGADPVTLVHGGHFVLVDGLGRLRGFYDPTVPAEAERLRRDLGLVANRGE